ncbi:cupin domain-containing protein [Halomicrococcus sp. NG-SE-24]|uniref:cupin domain-containing protein n=1 Tax=Halomicrococcus sp. NG-SE-24 TaxID=3436928 RepID=UPI003D96934E
MEYHTVQIDEVEPTPDRPSEHRSVSNAVGMEEMALNFYRVEPGEQLPLAYHVHEEQEEAFVVLSGALHVETPENMYVVNENAVFVAEPESPHRAYNPADSEKMVRVIAVGAPAVDDVHPYEPEDG